METKMRMPLHGSGPANMLAIPCVKPMTDELRDLAQRKRDRMKKSLLFALLIVATGIGFLMGGMIGTLVGYNLGHGKPDSGKVAAKKMTRDEFRSRVIGKTTSEVLAEFGKPADTSNSDNGVEYWHYANATVDPISGKTDMRVQVKFVGGRAVVVNF